MVPTIQIWLLSSHPPIDARAINPTYILVTVLETNLPLPGGALLVAAIATSGLGGEITLPVRLSEPVTQWVCQGWDYCDSIVCK